MTTLKPMTIALGLVALLTSAPAFAATMTGSVQTADGDSIAATIVVLYGSQGASLESHSTDDDGTFSIAIGAGAVAAAAKAANYASHEIEFSVMEFHPQPASGFTRCGSTRER